jgi:hypothetical protein
MLLAALRRSILPVKLGVSPDMPISWRVCEGFVRLESDGEVAFTEWRAAVDAALAHPDYRPGMGILHDWRRLRGAPSPEEIWRRADHGAQLGPIRWALVAPTTVAYGMGRMAEFLTEELAIELRVFRDIAEAEAWVRGEG